MRCKQCTNRKTRTIALADDGPLTTIPFQCQCDFNHVLRARTSHLIRYGIPYGSVQYQVQQNRWVVLIEHHLGPGKGTNIENH